MLCLNLHLAVIKWVMRKSQEIHSKISSFIQLWEKIQSEIGNLLCDVLMFLWFKVLKYFCVRWPELGKWIGNVATLTERTVCMVTNCSIHFTGKKLAICIICIWILSAWIIWAGKYLSCFDSSHISTSGYSPVPRRKVLWGSSDLLWDFVFTFDD